MAGRGPYRRWPQEQVALRLRTVIDQSTGPGFDQSGAYVGPPRGQARYSRAYWQQRRPTMDPSAVVVFDPPDLPRTPLPRGQPRYSRAAYQQHPPIQIDVSEPALDFASTPPLPIPKGQARYGRPTWAQYRPKIDVSEPALDLEAIPTPPPPRGQARNSRAAWQQIAYRIDVSTAEVFDPPDLPAEIFPRPPLRPARQPWQQYRPTIDVSEPALDLEAIPAAPPPRAQFRPLARPWWAQYHPFMDASATVVFDPPDLPAQITPRPPLRPTLPQRQQYRPVIDQSTPEASLDLPIGTYCRPQARLNRIPWMQYRPQVAPDRGIRPLLHEAAYDNVDRSVSYTSSVIGSMGPEAIVWVGLQGSAGTPPGVTLTGCGLTWTQETTDVQNVRRIILFSGVSATDSVPGALTFTLTDLGGGTSTIGLDYVIIGLQGADPSDLVVQTATDTGTAGTSDSITLATFLDPLNRPFSYFRHQQAEGTAPQTNWSELSDVQGGTPSSSAESQWRSDSADVAAAATWTANVQFLGGAAEIRVLGVPAEEIPPFYTPSRPQTRPSRAAYQQHYPTIDVSEPAFDLPPTRQPLGQARRGRPQWQQYHPVVDQSTGAAPDLDVPYIRHPRIRPHRLPHRGPRHQYRAVIDQSSTVPNAAGEVDSFLSITSEFSATLTIGQTGPRAFLSVDAVFAADLAVSIGAGAALTIDREFAAELEFE